MRCNMLTLSDKWPVIRSQLAAWASQSRQLCQRSRWGHWWPDNTDTDHKQNSFRRRNKDQPFANQTQRPSGWWELGATHPAGAGMTGNWNITLCAQPWDYLIIITWEHEIFVIHFQSEFHPRPPSWSELRNFVFNLEKTFLNFLARCIEGVPSLSLISTVVFLNKLNGTAINLDLERGEQIELGWVMGLLEGSFSEQN